MKNKVYDSFDKAINDIFDGAIVAHTIFCTAIQALNLWEALSRKNVKDITIVWNMPHPLHATSQGSQLQQYSL
jgi:acyl CoA:acetate/3-ketoacid CoA transferase alpha subunit